MIFLYFAGHKFEPIVWICLIFELGAEFIAQVAALLSGVGREFNFDGLALDEKSKGACLSLTGTSIPNLFHLSHHSQLANESSGNGIYKIGNRFWNMV